MITLTQMYWLTRLDSITLSAEVVVGVSIAILIFGILAITVCTFSFEESAPYYKTLLKWTIPPLLIAGLIGTFTPTTKEMAAILIIPRIANSEQVQTVGNKLYNLAVEWMDALRPSKGEKKGE